GDTVEQRRGERPAALCRGGLLDARAGEAPDTAVGARRLVAALGAERRPRVVRHLSRPDEIPQRRKRIVERELRPELRAAGERLANRVVRLSLGRGRSGRSPEQRSVVAEEDGDAV